MYDKKFTALMYAHLTLMTLLWITDLVMVILLLHARTHPAFADYLRLIPTDAFMTVSYVMDAASLCAGMLYLAKRCRKEAVGFYRTFMLCAAAAQLMYAVSMANQLVPGSTPAPEPRMLYILAVTLSSCKCILLLILTFAQNLGKRWTWALFCVLLVIDLFYAVCSFRFDHVWYFRLAVSLTCLLTDGTIGLIILEKYDDKTARGTK